MKGKLNQLPLFANQPPAAVHDRIEFCTRCGAEIVLQRHSGQGLISGYRSRDGECFACAFKARNVCNE
jgi:hypothetical protein